MGITRMHKFSTPRPVFSLAHRWAQSVCCALNQWFSMSRPTMNRSQVPVKQVSLQRPQSPRESGSALDQMPRLTPVPAAVPVSKHPSPFMHLYYALEARRTSMISSCDPVHLAFAEGRRQRDVFGIRTRGSRGAGRAGYCSSTPLVETRTRPIVLQRSNAGRRIPEQ